MAGLPEMEGFWVHFVETVYGAWLYGDARGFRTHGITGSTSRGITRTVRLRGGTSFNAGAAWRA
jgi:hypothetical protein